MTDQRRANNLDGPVSYSGGMPRSKPAPPEGQTEARGVTPNPDGSVRRSDDMPRYVHVEWNGDLVSLAVYGSDEEPALLTAGEARAVASRLFRAPRSEHSDHPEPAVRAIADTSRAETPTVDRELDAQCALDALRVAPLADRVAVAVWLLAET